MKNKMRGTSFGPLDPVVYWKTPGTWVWIPGTSWQACVYPSYIEFRCLETGFKRLFHWHIDCVEKLQGQFELQKGKVKLIIQSLTQYLQLSMWADTSHQPCLEITRQNGLKAIEVSWDNQEREVISARKVYAVISAQALLRKPSQVSPQSTPVLWFGTNKRLDFERFDLSSCPWMWSYALLMAARWLPPIKYHLVKWPFHEMATDQDWSKVWLRDFVKSSKGLFCFDKEAFSLWSQACRETSCFQPLEALEAMAVAFYKRWVEVDLTQSVISIHTQGGFCPPAGRLELCQQGIHLSAHWRAFRLRTLDLDSKLDQKLGLFIQPHPKAFRQREQTQSLRGLQSQKLQGKLLDLELIAGAHYKLDRFEY